MEGKLSKTLSLNETTKHIKSLSDVKELNLTENKAYKGDGPENVYFLTYGLVILFLTHLI